MNRNNPLFTYLLAFALLQIITHSSWAQVSFDFTSSHRGPMLGELHYGIFYEEINHGGDGGLYAELIRNRSFEDNAANPDCWWGLGGMQMEVVSTGLLNDAQGHALKMTVNEYNAGVRNEGFWGINIVQGETYTLTFWAKTQDHYEGKLWAELQNDNFHNLGRTEFNVNLTSEWQKFTIDITATTNETKGWLAIKALEPMVIYLDVVSLMPPTYKNRPNGCRRDLAELLAALHPRFLRFPGGCFVEGTWRDNQTNRFEWKKTIGPIERRPGHMNVNWGYRVSDGLGFHELLQLSEDLGAEPLFVVNVGLGHGWSQSYTDLREYIQEALDALEYANGDTSTKYGALRAEAGHPEPFNLRLLEIGNENYNFVSWDNGDQSDHYAERYAAFYEAIKKKYPDVVLIGNVEAWATDEPSWRNGNPVEIVDEHYYRSTTWFGQQYNKYDKYNRDRYKVYVGEYAVTSDFGSWGNLNAALGEAVYMAGMERNSDVCVMASYAPIFCNENHGWPWMPDMIRFNSSDAFGTPSYWVQQMMGSNVGYQNITWTERGNLINTINTSFALSSWGTAVTYDNLSIKDDNGQTLYSTDFSNADDYALNWNATGGSWNINEGKLNQTSTTMYGDFNVCYNLTGENSTIELDARKNSGSEGFLIAFSYNDPQNYVWWNLGGWNNTKHAIEQCVDGVKQTLTSASGSLTTGTTYHLRIVKAAEQVLCYINDSLYHQVSLPNARRVYAAAALNKNEDELIVKLINTGSSDQEATLRFSDFRLGGGSITAQVLTSAHGSDENIMQDRLKVKPVTKTIEPSLDDSHVLAYNVPRRSLSILRIPVTDVTPQCDNDEPGDWEDITDRLRNADFASGQLGWLGSQFSNTPGTVAEFFNTTFNTYQTLTNMPIGEYRFEMDGFYRQGNIETAHNAHVKGTEKLNAIIYITAQGQTTSVPLMSIYDHSAPYAYSPYSYPDNLAGADVAFNNRGAYHANAVEAVLPTNGGTLRVGLRKTVGVGSDWTCFDNARLYYRRGDVVDGINASSPTLKGERTGAVYDLSGRQIAPRSSVNGSLRKGLYLVEGEKYIK